MVFGESKADAAHLDPVLLTSGPWISISLSNSKLGPFGNTSAVSNLDRFDQSAFKVCRELPERTSQVLYSQSLAFLAISVD